MNTVPTSIAGSITIALIVGLGVFAYPWLLKQRHGALAVAAATMALIALFYAFGSEAETRRSSLVFALIWALAPVVAGVIVHRLQSKPAKPN